MLKLESNECELMFVKCLYRHLHLIETQHISSSVLRLSGATKQSQCLKFNYINNLLMPFSSLYIALGYKGDAG